MNHGPIFSLDVHASYACRHSGACCTAGWAIPVEPHVRPIAGSAWLVPNADGACPQYDRPSRLCRIHRDHGESMLPISCHHFPRRALIDDRGTFVTLSHFCPTAAALLVDSQKPLTIVSNPRAFPPARGYEGLDARGDWPPLLRPDVLFDPLSFAMWERYLVEFVSGSSATVAETLERVARTGEHLRQWSPDKGSLARWTETVLNGSNSSSNLPIPDYTRFSGAEGFLRAAATVPPELGAPQLPVDYHALDVELGDRAEPALLRYLGARAFGSWTAYQSRGIRTQIAELFVTAAVLRVECLRACRKQGSALDRHAVLEAIRASDLLLVHLADRQSLVTWLRGAEYDESRDCSN